MEGTKISDLQHVIVCYGPHLGYYHGAKLQILRNHHWMKTRPICVVTERPELFMGYPCKTIKITPAQSFAWSIDNTNHFGIKLQGLKAAIETADHCVQKSLLLDTDMFWRKDPYPLFDLIHPNSSIMYQNEGPILGSRNRSIQQYEQALFNNPIRYEKILIV